MFHFVKKPRWVRSFYGDCTWEMPSTEKVLYLTFDDGPDPEETPYVQEQLGKYQAKASFFCLGQNVVARPGLYQELRERGHTVGNHSFSHLDGWKTNNKKYFGDIAEAARVIESRVFRPPYGHVTWNQVKRLKSPEFNLRTILWDVLSADFDENTSKEKCLLNVIRHAGPGSIVLFHDSAIASRNMRYALPRVLDHFSAQGYRFEAIKA
jgi:peptidoglycan-N-acetylglucosamine deacetylase